MRIALICWQNSSFLKIKDLLSYLPDVQIGSYEFVNNVLFSENGKQVSFHDVVMESDVYILDPKIPHFIKENLHHYFEGFSVSHIYGKSEKKENVPHDFLVSKKVQIGDIKNDIEQTLANLWTTIAHPVRVRRKESVSSDISSIHELRSQTLPHILQGEHMECVYQPKGRRLICTLVRNARGKKVYTTPLFEKISHAFSDKIFSASLSHIDKERIIKKLENLFAHYPDFPTLHIELMHTPRGIYLMHAAPIVHIDRKSIPETLHAVGMQPQEILSACLTSLSTK